MIPTPHLSQNIMYLFATKLYIHTYIHTYTQTQYFSLPRKSDADRKLEIVQYARCTRALVIRLLALVKWAGSSNSVQKCSVCKLPLMSNKKKTLLNTVQMKVKRNNYNDVHCTMPYTSIAGNVRFAESAVSALHQHSRPAGSVG